MGFLDKLKDAGKGALKGALTMAATSYGTTTGGKHKLCKISMNSTFDKLVFVKLATIEAEYVIKDSFKTFYVTSEDDIEGIYHIKLVYTDDETTDVMLTANKDIGSALPSAADRIAAQYENIEKFVSGMARHIPELSEDTKLWVNKIRRFCKLQNMF